MMSPENVALASFVALPVVLALAVRAFRRHVRRSTSDGPPGWWRLIAGNLLVLAFLCSVATLAGECWLRFAYDSTDTFGLLRTTDRWFERHWERNAVGVRDSCEYRLGAVPEGKRRVTILGDSFTTGQGVADVELRFANLLRSERPGWDVQVFAANGWDTAQQADFLGRVVPDASNGGYGSDLVVLVYCLNDICDLDPQVSSLGRQLAAARERGALTQASHVFDTLRFLWLVSTVEDVRGYFPHLSSLYAGDVWAAQRARLRDVDAVARSRGARLVTVTFPMIHQLDGDYPFRSVHHALAEHWRAEDIPHLDLLPVFEGMSADDLVVGALDAHPNERAHALAAEALLPFIDAALEQR